MAYNVPLHFSISSPLLFHWNGEYCQTKKRHFAANDIIASSNASLNPTCDMHILFQLKRQENLKLIFEMFCSACCTTQTNISKEFAIVILYSADTFEFYYTIYRAMKSRQRCNTWRWNCSKWKSIRRTFAVDIFKKSLIKMFTIIFYYFEDNMWLTSNYFRLQKFNFNFHMLVAVEFYFSFVERCWI